MKKESGQRSACFQGTSLTVIALSADSGGSVGDRQQVNEQRFHPFSSHHSEEKLQLTSKSPLIGLVASISPPAEAALGKGTETI